MATTPEWLYGQAEGHRRDSADVAALIRDTLSVTAARWLAVAEDGSVDVVWSGTRQIAHFVITDAQSGMAFTVAVSPADKPRA